MLDQGAFGMIRDEYDHTRHHVGNGHQRPYGGEGSGHQRIYGGEGSGHQRTYGGEGSGRGSRGSSVREVSDHLEDWDPMEMRKKKATNQNFLRKVQTELESQRREWKDEVDRLTNGSLIRSLPKDADARGTNSFVDTSTGVPIFTALVDVSEFRNRSVEVDFDEFSNKLIVRGQSRNGMGTMTKTFTQKVQLPRFADDQRIRTQLSNSGILKVEVPLLYYTPETNKGREVKSFVNEVRTERDGSKTLEILVNTGPGVRAKDLHVQVTEERVLHITAQTSDDKGRSVRKLIKKYTLPLQADIDHIRSRMGKDGRLMVLIPLRK